MEAIRPVSVVLVVLATTIAAPVFAQATASVLSIASPLDLPAIAQPLVTCVDDAGRVMIAYKGKVDRDADILPYSALLVNGSWQHAAIPPPDLANYASSLTLRGVAPGPGDGSFHLIATHYGKGYYWRWQNGAWSPPETIEDMGGVRGFGVLPDGSPLVEAGTTRVKLHRRGPEGWAVATIPREIGQWRVGPSVQIGTQGAVRVLARHFQTPIVATMPAGADPLLAESWTFNPETVTSGMTSPPGNDTYQAALDWPHQLIYATWEDRGQFRVAWAPIGATSAEQWQVADVPVREGEKLRRTCLLSNGRGAVGLLVESYKSNPYACLLHFHWLSATGLGPAIPLLRPGTETEAAIFTMLDGENMQFCVDAQGTAHVAIVGTKRGEVPADTKRLYYATVTGGGTATEGPEVAGGGTTQMQREGAPPDFIVRIVKPAPDNNHVSFSGGTGGQSNSLSAVIEVVNQGAEYYGDLWLELNFDGAVMRLRYADESGHTRPLLTRDGTKTFYLPEVRYFTSPQPGFEPPLRTLDYGTSAMRERTVIATGLGRKLMTVTVDPDNLIEEADEDNNVAQAEYVVGDGRRTEDRERISSAYILRGLNDLAVGAPVLLSNTPLLRAGYIQAPTRLDVLVSNPLLAGFFLNAEVLVTLDEQEVHRGTIAMLDREPNLASATLGNLVIYDPTGTIARKDISGEMFRVPVDLTNVPEGNHTITVQVDPDDRFGDRRRDNNTARLDIRVRPPGGTLRVRVVDFTDPNRPVPEASVTPQDLWWGRTDEQGRVEIPDVPAGAYDAQALCAQKRDGEPPYYPGTAQPFTVVSRQPTDVVIRLEKPLTVRGVVTVAQTGALLADEHVEVFALADDVVLPGSCTGGHYEIPGVPPGECTVVAGAYGYATVETPTVVRRGGVATDEMTLNLTLTDGPRCTLTGRVMERMQGQPMPLLAAANELIRAIRGPGGELFDATAAPTDRPLGGAFVWLANAPRGALSAADGTFTIERVAASGADMAWGDARDHATRGVETGDLAGQGGQIIALGDIILPQVRERLTTVAFDCDTLAICNETAAAGAIPKISVDTSFGSYTGELGMMYHETAGQDAVTVDYVAVWMEGGDFIKGGVSTEIGVDKLTGVSLDTLKVGEMDTLLGGIGKVFSLISGVNKAGDFLYGDVDPSQMHRNNRVTANYISHTGTEYKQDPLIDIPTSTDVPVAVTFHGGGTTRVRVDYIILNDGVHPEHKAYVCWYSPGFAVFYVGKQFNLGTLDVKLWAAVLNDRLSSGVLGNASRNQLWWKPGETDWLRIEGYAYEVSFQ